MKTKASIKIEMQGYDEFVRQLRNIGGSVQQNLEQIVTEESEPLRAEVARRAPRGEEGNLVDVGLKVTLNDVRGVSIIIGPKEKGFYGKFLELGTKYIKARPFMAPAFELYRERIRNGIKQRIAALIKRVIGA